MRYRYWYWTSDGLPEVEARWTVRAYQERSIYSLAGKVRYDRGHGMVYAEVAFLCWSCEVALWVGAWGSDDD